MNILEQEDLIKGLPDQVLVEEAQAPTGNVPQYLVVSEIQRREKMREKFNEQVPQNTVTEQIISGGIAAMNPNPDPLMGVAMGAPPPMMGQDPMMQPPMQDPMMGQMQDPMMGQMPQDPMQQMQDPMMQQQMMAAGGGMMPYRMNQGRTVPSPLEYNIINMGGGSYINEGGVYPRGRRDDTGSPVLNRMGNQIMYAEGDTEKETILGALGEDTGIGGGVQGVIDRAVQKGLSQEQVPKLVAAALNLRRPPDIGELTEALEAHGFYVPPLNEIAELSGEENSDIPADGLAQSSVKPSISSTALRDDVSRSAKPKLGEAGFLEGFDPELARMIAASEAGSVKVNPKAAVREEAKAEQLDALNVLEEMGSARYEIQRGDTLSGIAQDHGTTVEALALANKISNPDMIYAGETLEMAADGGMMPFRMANVGEVPYQEDFSLSPIAPDKVRLLRAQGYSDEQILQMIKEEGLNRGTPTGQELYGVGEEADIFKGRTSYPLVPESVTEGVKDVLEGSDIAKYGFGYQRNEGGQQGLMGVPMGAAEDLANFSEMARQSQIVRDPIGSSQILSLIDRGMEVPRRGYEQLIEGLNLARPYINTENPNESLSPEEVGRRGEEVLRNIDIPLNSAGEEVKAFFTGLPGTELVSQESIDRGVDEVGSFFSSLIDSVSGAFREDASRVTDEQRDDPDIVKQTDATETADGLARAEKKEEMVPVQGVVPTGDADRILKTAAINVGTPAQTEQDTESLSRGLFGRSYKPMDDGALALINLGAGIAKGDITGGMQSAVTAMGEERDRRRKEDLSSAQAEFYRSGQKGASKASMLAMREQAVRTIKDMGLVNRTALLSQILGTKPTREQMSDPVLEEQMIALLAARYAQLEQISARSGARQNPSQRASNSATATTPMDQERFMEQGNRLIGN